MSKEIESVIDGDSGLTLINIAPKRRRRKQSASEAEIQMEAYFIWEKTGKTREAQDCWFEAKKNLGVE